MSQAYNYNIEKPKPQDTQLGILKIHAFFQKLQQIVSGQERVLLELPSPDTKISVAQGRAQLEHCSHILTFHANTSVPDRY